MKKMIGVMFFLLLAPCGCGPVLVGGAATGAYKTATDERTVGAMMDDKTITTRVNVAFMEDPQVHTMKIDVDTLEGNVILTGVVGSRAEADRAIQLARGVPGVVKVTDNLQIGTKSLGQSFNDKVLATRIKTRLIMDPDIRSLNIDVDVERGVVTLTGIVDSEWTKRKVLKIARGVDGTSRIVDLITVAAP